MAFTWPIRFSITFLDFLGTEANQVVYALADQSLSINDAILAWESVATNMQGACDAAVVAGSVQIIMPDTVINALPRGGVPGGVSRVEQTAVLNFSQSGDSHRFAVLVPGLESSQINGIKLITNPGTPLGNIITLLTGGVGSFAQCTSASWLALTSLRDSLLSFRQRGKQLHQSSTEH